MEKLLSQECACGAADHYSFFWLGKPVHSFGLHTRVLSLWKMDPDYNANLRSSNTPLYSLSSYIGQLLNQLPLCTTSSLPCVQPPHSKCRLPLVRFLKHCLFTQNVCFMVQFPKSWRDRILWRRLTLYSPYQNSSNTDIGASKEALNKYTGSCINYKHGQVSGDVLELLCDP